MFPPLDPRYYDAEAVMIGHDLAPMESPIEGIYWCKVCGGHPSDPIHKAGYTESCDG
jgi:hypothetical protein